MSDNHTKSRQRYRNRRYSCRGERHRREYQFYQYENYLRHCRTWHCDVKERDKGQIVKQRMIKLGGG